MDYLSSDTLITPSSLGMMTAELTTSWKASILFSWHGFRVWGCGWCSEAMGCTTGAPASEVLPAGNGRVPLNLLKLASGQQASTQCCDGSDRSTVKQHKCGHTETPFPLYKIKLPVSLLFCKNIEIVIKRFLWEQYREERYMYLKKLQSTHLIKKLRIYFIAKFNIVLLSVYKVWNYSHT